MEGDRPVSSDKTIPRYFNPLPPHGGRLASSSDARKRCFISIHSLRMEGDHPLPESLFQIGGISIHSLRMEGDHRHTETPVLHCEFQSTPSAWRETFVENDEFTIDTHFNPLPPHGGRRDKRMKPTDIWTFQSTPSAWRETVNSPWRLASHESFQSTPSAWRETEEPQRPPQKKSHFNPLPPHGGRLQRNL